MITILVTDKTQYLTYTLDQLMAHVVCLYDSFRAVRVHLRLHDFGAERHLGCTLKELCIGELHGWELITEGQGGLSISQDGLLL